MAQSKLLVHAAPDGVGHRITPESAGWRYVGFETRALKAGARSTLDTGDREVCVVILAGKARVTANGFDSGTIGEREKRVRGPALVGLSAAPRRGDHRGFDRLRARAVLGPG